MGPITFNRRALVITAWTIGSLLLWWLDMNVFAGLPTIVLGIALGVLYTRPRPSLTDEELQDIVLRITTMVLMQQRRERPTPTVPVETQGGNDVQS